MWGTGTNDFARPLYDDIYSGPRYTYGLTYRPVGYAQVPVGWVMWSERPHPDFRYGTVDYPAPLSENAVRGCQLTRVWPADESVAHKKGDES